MQGQPDQILNKSRVWLFQKIWYIQF